MYYLLGIKRVFRIFRFVRKVNKSYDYAMAPRSYEELQYRKVASEFSVPVSSLPLTPEQADQLHGRLDVAIFRSNLSNEEKNKRLDEVSNLFYPNFVRVQILRSDLSIEEKEKRLAEFNAHMAKHFEQNESMSSMLEVVQQFTLSYRNPPTGAT